MKKWVLILGLTIFTMQGTAHGQGCAVCTKTASELSPKGARGLNGGILYLAFLPLAILGTIGFFWWRQRGAE